MAGVEASYLGPALVENRNGPITVAMVTRADGYTERDAALFMLSEQQAGRSRRITAGADKAYTTRKTKLLEKDAPSNAGTKHLVRFTVDGSTTAAD